MDEQDYRPYKPEYPKIIIINVNVDDEVRYEKVVSKDDEMERYLQSIYDFQSWFDIYIFRSKNI